MSNCMKFKSGVSLRSFYIRLIVLVMRFDAMSAVKCHRYLRGGGGWCCGAGERLIRRLLNAAEMLWWDSI